MMAQSKISHLHHSTVLGTPNGLFSFIFLFMISIWLRHLFFWPVRPCIRQVVVPQSPTLFASHVGLKDMFRYAIVFCLSL
jgi:hypothetical protein